MNVINMTLERAERILKNTFKNIDLISVVDYGDWYVFDTAPSGYDYKKQPTLIRALLGVNKLDGKAQYFNPLQHDTAKYSKAIAENIKYY